MLLLQSADTAQMSDRESAWPNGRRFGFDAIAPSSQSDLERVAFLIHERSGSSPQTDGTHLVSSQAKRADARGEEIIFKNPPVQSCAPLLAVRRGISL